MMEKISTTFSVKKHFRNGGQKRSYSELKIPKTKSIWPVNIHPSFLLFKHSSIITKKKKKSTSSMLQITSEEQMPLAIIALN